MRAGRGGDRLFLKLMYLHPNVLQTPHYQVISVAVCVPQKKKGKTNSFRSMGSIFTGDVQSDGVGVLREAWGEERRRCSLQRDGNKEQMERTRGNKLTFMFCSFAFFFFCFLPVVPNVFPQECGYTSTPSPTRTQTKPCGSSPKRSTPPASRSRKSLASVRLGAVSSYYKCVVVAVTYFSCRCSNVSNVQTFVNVKHRFLRKAQLVNE